MSYYLLIKKNCRIMYFLFIFIGNVPFYYHKLLIINIKNKYNYELCLILKFDKTTILFARRYNQKGSYLLLI